MSLQPSPFPPVPESTAAVARAAFRRPPLAVRLRDEFGALYEACPARAECVRAPTGGRQLMLHREAEHTALAAARARDASPAGRRDYALRAGVESTISQAVRAFGLRRARYRGLPKVHLQHVAAAAALNLERLHASLAGRPLAPTRVWRFARLAA